MQSHGLTLTFYVPMVTQSQEICGFFVNVREQVLLFCKPLSLHFLTSGRLTLHKRHMNHNVVDGRTTLNWTFTYVIYRKTVRDCDLA